jgi:uncharacterized protein YkwD
MRPDNNNSKKVLQTSLFSLTILFSLTQLNLSWAQTLSNEPEVQLIKILNDYRLTRGLPIIPISPSLMKVAEAHAKDLEKSSPAGACNMHSWSSSGDWSSCCYTPDHAKAQCMWNKPREITSNFYTGNGFEIAYKSDGIFSLPRVIDAWKRSSGHHAVMVNSETWEKIKWEAIGAGISEHYAVVWFGQEPEPEPLLTTKNTEDQSK